MDTGAKIKQKRLEIGMSQREFSKKVGYTDHSIVTRIESGQVDLPLSKLKKISEILDVSVPWLMGMDEENKTTIPTDMDEMAALWSAASEDKRKQALQYLRFILSEE